MTDTAVVPPRSEIADEHKFNKEYLFTSPDAWMAAFRELEGQLDEIEKYHGHLGDGPQTLADWFDLMETLQAAFAPVFIYASMSYAVDTTDQEAAGLVGRSRGLMAKFAAAGSFSDPELLAIGRETLEKWVKEEPRLQIYAHYIDDLFRQQEHVATADVEQVLGMMIDPGSAVRNTADTLINAEMMFDLAVSSTGETFDVTQSSIRKNLISSDRERRRTAYESYANGYRSVEGTLASNLSAAMKMTVLRNRVRKYPSALEASLDNNNIPTEIFHNLIATFKDQLPVWHRYWDVRRRILELDDHQPYDVWAPLSSAEPVVPFEQAVEYITTGLVPLGEYYVETLRRGCLQDRWVDKYPNIGKQQGAFSMGMKGTLPYIKMSYTDDVSSMSTLAHELGHSMHSFLSWENQPFVYARYTIFQAEVASNFNQAMVRAYLLENSDDRDLQVALIEEAMSNFHRYFLIMPTLAQWELGIYERVERNEPVTAPVMNKLCVDLFAEAYGDTMTYNPDHVGITWAQFQHMYMNFYVFQYATGIAGAHALANRVMAGEDGAVEAYLGFLKAGSSKYALETLLDAGVDLSTPEPVVAAFEVMSGYIDRLEELLLG